jgi:hypothetical protein
MVGMMVGRRVDYGAGDSRTQRHTPQPNNFADGSTYAVLNDGPQLRGGLLSREHE